MNKLTVDKIMIKYNDLYKHNKKHWYDSYKFDLDECKAELRLHVEKFLNDELVKTYNFVDNISKLQITYGAYKINWAYDNYTPIKLGNWDIAFYFFPFMLNGNMDYSINMVIYYFTDDTVYGFD